MALDLDTRNAFETKNILKTFQVTRNYVLDLGEYPEYNHSSRIKEHFYLTEILLCVISLESYLYGMSNHFSFIPPKKMPNPDRSQCATRPTVSASLEYKLHSYLNEAKARIKYLRVYNRSSTAGIKPIPTKVRSEIIKTLNNSFKMISLGLKVRNKLAHGETYNALNSSKNKKKDKLSKFIREINKTNTSNLVNGVEQFKEICDILLSLNSSNAKLSGIHKFVFIASRLKRNDYLAMVGKISSDNSFSLITSHGRLLLDNKSSDLPIGYENVHSYLFVMIASGVFSLKKKKNINGATLKFLTNNGFRKNGRKITDNDVNSFFINSFWNKMELSKIYLIDEKIAGELFIIAINIGVENCARILQQALNDLSLAVGCRVKIEEDGIIEKRTLKLLKRLSKYSKAIIKSLISRQIAYYHTLRNDKNAVKMILNLENRLVYSSKRKTIDYCKFY